MQTTPIPSMPPLALALGRLRPRGTAANPRAWPFAPRPTDTPASEPQRGENQPAPANDFLILNPSPTLTAGSGPTPTPTAARRSQPEAELPLLVDPRNGGTYWFDL